MQITNWSDKSTNKSLFIISHYWWFLVAVQLVAIVYVIITRVFNIDEFESIHAGWKILNGEIIYDDFIQEKNPLLYYLLAVVIKIFGESINSILASSFFILIFSAGIVIYTYHLAKLIFNTETAAVSVLLLPLMPWFLLSGIEVRPDVPMLFFCMSSLYYLYQYFYKQNNKKLIYSAICLGISFLFIQKAIFWFVFFMGIFIHRYFRRDITVHKIIQYWITLLLVYVIFLIFISFNTSLSSYFFFTFKFVAERQEILGGPGNIIEITNELMQLNRFAWVILPAFFITLILGRLSKSQWEIALGALWLLLTVFLVTHPGARYFLPAMPLIVIIISYGLVRLIHTNRIHFPTVLTLLVVILAWNCRNIVDNPNRLGIVDHNRQQQLSRVRLVLDITDKDDYVYDGMNKFNLFRKDLDFVWLGGDRFVHHSSILAKLKPYRYDIYELVIEKNPKVISHYYLDINKYPLILGKYRRSAEFDDVYIRYKNNTGFNHWDTFVDNLGSGSSITPTWDFFTDTGDIEVKMHKAADPSPNESTPEPYPYVGIGMEFDHPTKTVDLTDAENIVLTYKLSGPVSLLLVQDGIKEGEDFRVDLPPAEEYTEKTINWDDFYQPAWISKQQTLDFSHITGIKFQLTTPEQSSAVFGIKSIRFTGLKY